MWKKPKTMAVALIFLFGRASLLLDFDSAAYASIWATCLDIMKPSTCSGVELWKSR